MLTGSGGYADDTAGGVSSTGHGEAITKLCLAHSVINQMKSLFICLHRPTVCCFWCII